MFYLLDIHTSIRISIVDLALDDVNLMRLNYVVSCVMTYKIPLAPFIKGGIDVGKGGINVGKDKLRGSHCSAA